MNSALKWKLIAGFLLVFLAGGATGVFVSAATAHRFLFGPHRHGYAAQAMKNRLQWQLRLTDEQMAKISPIIEKTGTQLEEIRGDTGRRVREAIAERAFAANGTTATALDASRTLARAGYGHAGSVAAIMPNAFATQARSFSCVLPAARAQLTQQ